MSIIAVYNIKGGVGKTASSVNLAYLSSRQGSRTLLCDMDPQGSASFYFRIRSPKKFNSKKLLKGGKHIEENIKGTDFSNLDMLPADFSYRNIDIALDECKKSQQRLRKVLQPLQEEYDRIKTAQMARGADVETGRYDLENEVSGRTAYAPPGERLPASR